MPKTERPLTPQQLAIVKAAAQHRRGVGATEIARRAGINVEVVYPALARLVGRGVLSKAEGASRLGPRYSVTSSGAKALAAAEAFYREIA
jgi:DNA-binding IclR family transcriptional regulator